MLFATLLVGLLTITPPNKAAQDKALATAHIIQQTLNTLPYPVQGRYPNAHEIVIYALGHVVPNSDCEMTYPPGYFPTVDEAYIARAGCWLMKLPDLTNRERTWILAQLQ